VTDSRMFRHGFVERPARTVAEAAGLTGALQAQDLGAARLGVRARSVSLTDSDVRRAVDVDRTVVRTWLMRNTIHLIPAQDVRWLAALFGPMIQRRFAGKRWPELGLTPALLDRAADAAPEILQSGPSTRHELVAALADRGVTMSATGQAPTHLLLYLSTIGLVCHADGDRFALVDQWLPDAPPGPRGDDALAELARRYFRAYSPASGADFTTWSGLPSRAAIALIRDELLPVAGGFTLGAAPSTGGLRLLGGFDNFLLGYRDRDAIIAPSHRGEVYVGGVIRPTILNEGRMIGRWRLARPTRKNAPVVVEVRHFGRPTPSVREAVAAEVADIGRFLAVPTELGQLRR
jgi:hypothetical protein